MHIRKRMMALFCAAALLFSLVSTAGAAASAEPYTLTESDCTVEDNSTGVTLLTVKAEVVDAHASIVVPQMLGDKPVTVLGSGTQVFQGNCWYLRQVTLPEGLTEIAANAFGDCNDMTGVVLPGSLETIGAKAFQSCWQLTDAALPEGLASIGDYAFKDTALIELRLPESLVSVGTGAFSGTDLTVLDTESFGGLTALPDYLFSGCELLTDVALPDKITTLGHNLFSDCIALASVTLPSNMTALPAYIFSGCMALETVALPDGITDIGAYAFSGCHMLDGIALPDGLTTLGQSAFASCRALSKIAIPGGVEIISTNTFDWCWELTEVNLSEGLKSLDLYAFSNCRKLSAITFPSTLTSIHRLAFFLNTPRLMEATFLGAAPQFSEEANYFITTAGMTIYYPDGDASYNAWKTDPGLKATMKPLSEKPAPPIDTKPTQIKLTAELCRMPQKNMVLWLTTAVTYGANGALLPTGRIDTYFRVDGGEPVKQAPPIHFSAGGDAYHKTFGYDVTALAEQGATLTVYVEQNGSAGYASSASVALTGKVENYSDHNNHAFGVDPSDPTITTEYGWQLDEAGTGVVIVSVPTAELSNSNLVELPATLDNRPVTGLGTGLFSGAPLSRVSIPATVTDIGAKAFENCAMLYSATLPAAVKNLGADVFKGSGLASVTMLGSAPSVAEHNNPFPAATVLHTPVGDTSYHVSPWKEMKREPAEMTVNFPVVTPGCFELGAVGRMDLLLPVAFDVKEHPGENAPAPGLDKLEVWLGGNRIMPTLPSEGAALRIPIPGGAFGLTVELRIKYPGDDYYAPANKAATIAIPIQKLPVAITSVGAEIKTDAGKNVLWLTPVFDPANYYGQKDTAPKLDGATITLDGKAVTPTVRQDLGALLVPVEDAMLGKTLPVVVNYKGDERFEPAQSKPVSVSFPGAPAQTKLSVTAGEVLKRGEGYVLPLTAALTVENGNAGSPDRTKLTVKLGDSAASYTPGEGDVLYVAVPKALLGTRVKVTVNYPGEGEYPAAMSELPNLLLSDPNPVKASTTLTAAAEGFTWVMSPGLGYSLSLVVKLEHESYQGDNSLVPDYTAITVKRDGTQADAKDILWLSGGKLAVAVSSALYGKTVSITLDYPGDAWFMPSTKTFSVLVVDPNPAPPPSGNGGGGGSSAAAKPSDEENAKVTVSDKAVTEAVKAAADSGSVVLKADAPADAKSVAVTVPASLMKAVAKAEAPVSLQTPVADLKLDIKVLEALQAGGAKDVVVSAGTAAAAALPKAAQETLTGRPVYDISITSGGKAVSQFGGGSVTVSLPYTPAAGEDPSCLTACWVKEDGTTEVLHSSAYQNGKLTFRTPHLSTYAILYTDVTFLDVAADAWAGADIGFATARGILRGMGDNGAGGELFGPSVQLTGSMAVVSLARMDGVADGSGEAWAAPALAWAEGRGMLPAGFDSAAALSREQFAYLVAGFLGGAQETEGYEYTDVEQLSLPYLDSVNYLTSLEIMKGTGDGQFSPQATLTRSELAAVLHRLVLLQMD